MSNKEENGVINNEGTNSMASGPTVGAVAAGAGFDEAPMAPVSEHKRCACAVLLDCSGSMAGQSIQDLNMGLVELKKALETDSLARRRVEVALISFGGTGAQLLQDFARVDDGNYSVPQLEASGGTPMGGALNLAMELLTQRKAHYRKEDLEYFRPWIFMITDGGPTDQEEFGNAMGRLHEMARKKGCVFFAVGVEGANFDLLRQLAPDGKNVFRLKDESQNFGKLFAWLSASLSAVASTEKVAGSGEQQTKLPDASGILVGV